MKSAEIRQKFLDFFAQKGHQIVASSSLIPANDPTILFTNAGMNQFKDVFLGFDKRPYNRATTSQKCVRAGGKHNDLENVGYTARHHTFFEMLGNFSFGDYFKRDAILFAWEFLTSPEWLNLPKEKLWVTIYATDDEAFEIWHKDVGLTADRIIRIGDNKGAKYASDNFWAMGDTGPCGPCTEIFYDHGAHIPGGLPGTPEEDGDRYIEIWNNVFMQFNRDEAGVMHPLPKPSVDTGMGLERISAVMQKVHANYEIDLFVELLQAAAKVTGVPYNQTTPSLKVIADHIRACAFLIADGALPANDGRGYVLRRIIRRAIRHGYKLGQKGPFFHKLVAPLANIMGEAYPELRARQAHIEDALKLEEELFGKTLTNGMELLDSALTPKEQAIIRLKNRGYVSSVGFAQDMPSTNCWFTRVRKNEQQVKIHFASSLNSQSDWERFITHGLQRVSAYNDSAIIMGLCPKDMESALDGFVQKEKVRLNISSDISSDFFHETVLDGATAFKLADTFGFPIDLTADVCRERGLSVDMAGFEAALDAQRKQSKAAGHFKMAAGLAYEGAASCFHGYDKTSYEAKVLALYKGSEPVQQLSAGDEGVVVLDHTPFYAESGGQAGDVGEIFATGGVDTLFDVTDTQKVKADVFGHQGALARGSLNVGDAVTATLDLHKRSATTRNHSATHLLHAALREVLGKHVEQKGSLVTWERTRFDFSHPKPVSSDEITKVEQLVNHVIMHNAPLTIASMGYDDAIKAGAMALFGEKYGDEVRVVKMGDFSTELCGGTHVGRTGNIGLCKVIAEGGVAAGIRRIEAVTGEGALALVQSMESEIKEALAVAQAQPGELVAKLGRIQDHAKSLEKELAKLKAKLAASQGDELVNQAADVSGIKVLAAVLEGADNAALRETLDKLKDKLKTAAIVLASVSDGKVALIAGVTADTTGKIKAGELVNFVALQVGGKGGGRPDMAQAGGTQPENLAAALASVAGWVKEKRMAPADPH